MVWTGERRRINAAGALAGHDWRGSVYWDWHLHRRRERKDVRVLNGHRQAYSGVGLSDVKMWESKGSPVSDRSN